MPTLNFWHEKLSACYCLATRLSSLKHVALSLVLISNTSDSLLLIILSLNAKYFDIICESYF
jgi:hypothetical protein